VTIPEQAIPEHYSTTENKGFHITSTADINLIASFTQLASTGVTSILPTHSLGTRYIVLDYPADPDIPNNSGATVTIVATQPNTTVAFTPPCDLHSLAGDPAAPAAGTPTTVLIPQAGQTHTLLASSANASLSGMVITSDKPIAVFQGNQITGVPGNTPSSDMMYDQAIPVEHWGREYALVPTVGRSVGDRIRVVADTACSVTLSSGATFSLSQNGVHEFDLPASSPCILTSTKPVSVGFCSKGSDWNAEPGDGSLLIVPPTTRGLCHATFTTVTTQRISTWYLVAVTDQPATMTLDGNSIASQFQPVGTTAYSYARIGLSGGVHTLDNTSGIFTAWTYGVGNCDSYIYSLGHAIEPQQPQIPDCLGHTQGCDFWATFLCNDDDPANSVLSLIATGAQAASVMVTNPVTEWTQTTSIQAGGKAQITLPTANTIPSGQPHNIGYHITSTAPVTLYSCNFKEGSWDFALVLPTFAIDDNYIVQNYPNNSDHPANVAFVATEDGTELSMVLPCTVTGLGLPAGSPYTATLDAGQSLMLRADQGSDFSGMEVSSNCKPFALFQGCAAGRVGDNGTNSGRDHFFEQALPPAMWGTEFVADASLDRSEGDRVVVTAGADNCTVEINGSIVATLMRGQSHEYILNANTTAHIVTSRPAYACLYLVSYRNGGTLGDPGAATLPPVNRWVCHSDFMLHQCNNNPSSQYYIASPYINIIAENSAVGALALDGTVIPSSQFSPISGTSFSHTRMHINYGAHTLDGGGAGAFSARAYGLGQWVGFAYNIDMLLDTIEPCVTQLHHDTITYSDSVCQGQPYLLPTEIVCGGTTYFPPSGLIYVRSTETAEAGTLERWSNWAADDTVHHIHLTLTVLPSFNEEVYVTLTPGESVTFADTLIADTGTYLFHYTAMDGCDSTVTLHVQDCVMEVCIEASRDFIDFDHPVITLYDCSPDRYSSTWIFSDGYILTGERARRQFSRPLPDTVTVTLRSCNQFGCCADTTIGFRPEIRSVWFPNIFTPGESINNRFGPVTSCQAAEFEIFIYNRWGLLVYHTTDISMPWDGTHDNTPCSQGAYAYRWYLKDVHGDRWSGDGIVTLIR